MTDELPAILLALGVVYLIYRTCFKGAPADPNDPLARGPLRGVTNDMVSTVTSAFPHTPAANIVYSLSKTRSAQATSEIILESGSLPAPPPGFPVHPYLATAVPVSTAPVNSASSSSTSMPGKTAPSLIERYGLSARIRSQDKGKPVLQDGDRAGNSAVPATHTSGGGVANPANPSGDKGWAQTPEEREKALQERKERMVLEARRKMLEKQAARKQA